MTYGNIQSETAKSDTDILLTAITYIRQKKKEKKKNIKREITQHDGEKIF